VFISYFFTLNLLELALSNYPANLSFSNTVVLFDFGAGLNM
jgi:hypothetical protein